jgi:hypothetical protein
LICQNGAPDYSVRRSAFTCPGFTRPGIDRLVLEQISILVPK